ncbi:M10 family metallopeptidase [Cognatiyoonia sp. IB215182]|uniref:M10 family metallopeptidase n=1 Tax=Cognatiyoonia sp. IB215182 TaxID=3097353 RepID=UPI002A0EEE41|nr:M10 family metallopeptidase [Cognatiyoonia sp. IB215182]MDX8354573.1 M10 family metallopeptidase [Cognatiyoonia sp. IB215182]
MATFDNTISEGWSSYERARVEAALASIAAVANVTFTITSNPNADFQLVKSDDPFSSAGSLGYFYLPNFTGQSVGVFNSDGFGWDTSGLREGGTGYTTIVHELLHGLGLAHPHDGTVLQGVTSPFNSLGNNDLNQGIYSTMSYNSGYYGTPNFIRGSEAGPMAFDIAALQEIYGANMSHATGDDIYELDASNSDGSAWKSIWDAGGTDTIRYSGSADVVIDLRAATLQYEAGGGGFISNASGISGGYTIANGVVIENAIGGSGNDTLIGNDADNTLTGNGGNDVLKSGSGDDNIDAGGGNDNASGGTGDDEINAGSGNDTVNGNSGVDEITTSAGTNTIYGGSGGDSIFGGTGRDTIYAGSGNDTVEGNGDADTIFGGRGNDDIDGGAGNDLITGGLGQDTLTGGDGSDDFIFEFISDSLVGAGNRDVILDFEVGVDDIDLSAFGGLNFSDDITLSTSGGNTVVGIDVNGDNVDDMEIFVSGVTNLSQGDFLL